MSDWTYKEWYEANGGSYNTTRRQRYKDDPAYRKSVTDRNRVARDERKKVASTERQAVKLAVKTRSPRRSWREVDGIVDGTDKELKLVSIGALAKMVGRSVQSMRIWERSGLLPATEYRTEKGDRLYTPVAALEFYERVKKEGKLKERSAPAAHKAVEYVVRLSDGTKKRVQLFKIGALAGSTGRSIVNLEQIESKGFLPETPLRTGRGGHRLYTSEMIESVKAAFDSRVRVRGADEWKALHEEILDGWKKLKMVGARIIERGEEDAGKEKEDEGEKGNSKEGPQEASE